MEKRIKHTLLELSDAVDNELFPIETLNDYIGELCLKAGSEKPYKMIELTFQQLFNITGSLENSIKNIKRVMKEYIEGAKTPKKQNR